MIDDDALRAMAAREKAAEAKMPRFHWHWTNDTAEADRAGRKRFPWKGRAWLHDHRKRRDCSIEWLLLGAARSTMLKIGPRKLYVGIWGLFALYITPPFRIWPIRRPSEVYWYQGDLVWDFFGDPDPFAPISSRDRAPWWRKGRWNPKDFFFGRAKHSKIEIEKRDVLIPMPEGPYPGTAALELCTWTRPRWPWWPLKIERVHSWVDCPIGVPHEGKGESGYDCGEDAIFGQGARAKTIEDAVGQFVATSLRSRRRYGNARPGAYPHPDERARRQEARRAAQGGNAGASAE